MIPENFSSIMEDGSGKATVFLYEKDNRFIAKGYKNKRKNADFHYSFRTEEQRKKYVLEWFSVLSSFEEEKTKIKMGRKTALSSVYYLLHRNGWRKLAPDKRHVKTDVVAQEDWKKNSRRPLQGSTLNGQDRTDQSNVSGCGPVWPHFKHSKMLDPTHHDFFLLKVLNIKY